MYIALSGIDGSGKSTATRAVISWLEQNRPAEIVRVREPGSTPEAEAIRNLLLHEAGVNFNTKQQLLLMSAARDSLLEGVVKPALSEEKHVVSDRCFLSSLAYQVDSSVNEKIFNVIHHDMITPDIIIVLDVNVDTADERMGDVEKDNIERKGKSYQDEVRKRYLKASRNNPFIIVVSAEDSEEKVYHNVIQSLTEAVIDTSPLSIVIVDDVLSYYGSQGHTSVHVEIVYESLINYGYTFDHGEDGLWGVKLGYGTIGSGFLNEQSVIKLAFADAIQRGYWNGYFNNTGNSGESGT